MSRLDLAMEHKVVRQLRGLPHLPRTILVAVSGGLDSMVLAEILLKWRAGLGVKLGVAHVHHGRSPRNEAQDVFRVQAQQFVRQWAEQRKLPFFTNDSEQLMPSLTSEADFRRWRTKLLREWCEQGGFSAVAMAHHRDDLLETRLIRLIRGSGKQGLRAMSLYQHRPPRLRPLLVLSRQEIQMYAEAKSLRWFEDPSNASAEPLRNWLRGTWLPLLENKRPGALKALARSLEALAPATSARAGPPNDFNLPPYVGLRREWFLSVSSEEKRELVALYFKSLGMQSYAATHVEEILKRLNTRQQNVEFEMLGFCFKISPDFLWASRV